MYTVYRSIVQATWAVWPIWIGFPTLANYTRARTQTADPVDSARSY